MKEILHIYYLLAHAQTHTHIDIVTFCIRVCHVCACAKKVINIMLKMLRHFDDLFHDCPHKL